jgi:uncharacterized protein (TIGR02118 family)
MIKVSVLYANGQAARFDHEYYRDRHVPPVAACLGTALNSYSIDKGLAGVSTAEESDCNSGLVKTRIEDTARAHR